MARHFLEVGGLLGGDGSLTIDERLKVHGNAISKSRQQSVSVIGCLLRVGGWAAILVRKLMRGHVAASDERFHGMPKGRRDALYCRRFKSADLAPEELRFVLLDFCCEAASNLGEFVGASCCFEVPPPNDAESAPNGRIAYPLVKGAIVPCALPKVSSDAKRREPRNLVGVVQLLV